jgi:uncharacterized membrane protein
MSELSSFLQAWYTAMLAGGILMFALGVIIYLVHNLRVAVIRDFKAKYDYINSHEVQWYKWTFYCFGAGVGLLINLYGAGERVLNTVGVWFFVRIFFGIAGATLVAYVAKLVLQYYYPTKLNTKLKKWRYMPRVNLKTGNRMRLLTEEEEDVHLDEGKRSEEDIFSIDYDVWIDEKSGDILVEKYQGHLTALRCNNCGFYTMKVIQEEISQQYDDGSPKEMIKHYKCEYCKNVRATAFPISKKEGEDYKNLRGTTKRNTKNIDAVRIEIHSVLSGKRFYEFSSLEQAQKFLDEFDLDKAAKS